jgi:hypothetical protein
MKTEKVAEKFSELILELLSVLIAKQSRKYRRFVNLHPLLYLFIIKLL